MFELSEWNNNIKVGVMASHNSSNITPVTKVGVMASHNSSNVTPVTKVGVMASHNSSNDPRDQKNKEVDTNIIFKYNAIHATR